MSTVLIIGDTHCPVMRNGYVRFLQGIADAYQPDRIVHIGDLIDGHSISFHERSPSLPSASDEFRRARRQIKTIVDAFPEADIMIGNHDALPQRQGTTAGLPDDCIKPFGELWELPWTVHARHSELLIDGVVYTHGEGPGGMYAHAIRPKMRFRSMVMGHFHANAGVIWHANTESRVFGLAVGTGVDHGAMQFAYGRPIPRKPMLGCGVVIDGKQAYFEPWCLKSR